MPQWKCEDCGNTVEAPQEPEQCPCGSENISRKKENGLINRIRSLIR